MRGDILLFIIKTTNFRTNTYIIILEILKTEKVGGEQLVGQMSLDHQYSLDLTTKLVCMNQLQLIRFNFVKLAQRFENNFKC